MTDINQFLNERLIIANNCILQRQQEHNILYDRKKIKETWTNDDEMELMIAIFHLHEAYKYYDFITNYNK
jgi:hypothetical protein